MKTLVFLLLLLPVFLYAGHPTEWDQQDIDLSWDGPSERVDGSPLDRATEIEFYTLLCGSEEEGPYDEISYQIPGLSDEGRHEANLEDFIPEAGVYFCRLTATDTDGLTSDYSENFVEVERKVAPPKAPTNFIKFISE